MNGGFHRWLTWLSVDWRLLSTWGSLLFAPSSYIQNPGLYSIRQRGFLGTPNHSLQCRRAVEAGGGGELPNSQPCSFDSGFPKCFRYSNSHLNQLFLHSFADVWPLRSFSHLATSCWYRWDSMRHIFLVNCKSQIAWKIFPASLH